MSNRNAPDRSTLEFICKWTVSSLDSHKNVFADEMQIPITDQRARQETGFAKNLKTIAYSQHKSTGLGKLLDRIHDWRESRQSARAEVVAIGKPAGYDHSIISAQIRVAMPDEIHRLTDMF
jgi:hypothetical protein